MSTREVVIIDYGVGNILSVRRGLERCGAIVTVTDNHQAILSAPRVVLPGVGAFASGMSELRSRGLDQVIQEVAARGTTLLGICLGMQMLLDESDEFGLTDGLGLIPGRVVRIPSLTANGQPQKLPHVGWSALTMPAARESWEGSILAHTSPGDAVYFVHTFMASPHDAAHRLADCWYGGVAISAAIVRDNLFGCQFHPEKSGGPGLNILSRFVST